MATARKNTVANDTVTFEYDGENYSYDKDVLDDADVLEAVDDNKLSHLLKLVVGAAQYAQFKEKKRTIKDLQEFATAAFEAAGTDLGK